MSEIKMYTFPQIVPSEGLPNMSIISKLKDYPTQNIAVKSESILSKYGSKVSSW